MRRIASLIFVATLVSGCSDTKPEATVAAAPLRSAPVVAPADEPMAISGPIVVENQVDVLSQRDGVVANVIADTGTPVRKGQLLATLDDRQLNAERMAAEAKMKSVAADVKNWEAETQVQESDLARAQAMLKADLITKQELDHAQYKVTASQFEVEREKQNLKSSQATLEALTLESDKTRIVAPFDGVVARRYVRTGQRVAKDDRLFWITATSPLLVKFSLPEKYLGRIERGAEIGLIATAVPDEKHSATVRTVSPVVDPASGTIEVAAEIKGPAGHLKPGMTVNISLPPSK